MNLGGFREFNLNTQDRRHANERKTFFFFWELAAITQAFKFQKEKKNRPQQKRTDEGQQ